MTYISLILQLHLNILKIFYISHLFRPFIAVHSSVHRLPHLRHNRNLFKCDPGIAGDGTILATT